jgi:hypothetical protein
MKKNRLYWTMSIILAISLAAVPMFAQQRRFQQGRPGMGIPQRGAARMNPMIRLNRALQQAGAPEFTESQREELQSYIEEFRAAVQPPAPGAEPPDRGEFNEAILEGDLPGAAAQAAVIAENQSKITVERLTAAADFAIKVIDLLERNQQLAPLQEWMGSNGVVNLALSLARAPRRGNPPI